MIETKSLFIESLILLILVSINGMLAMAEMSLVSASKATLEKHSQRGHIGAKAALNLNQRPTEVLSTLQLGMTFVGYALGVYSGSTLVEQMRVLFTHFNFSESLSQWIASLAVIILITFMTVIFGELVPKRIALYTPHQIAIWTGRPVLFLARFFHPIVIILVKTTDAICRIMGFTDSGRRTTVSPEDIKSYLQENTKTGAFDATERRMVEGVIDFSEARISSFMTPRPEVVWLDIDDPAEKNRKKIIEARHSHFPIVKGSLENVVGVIHVKDILSRQLLGQPFDLTLYLEQALYLPENASASRSVDLFRNSAMHFAFVINEYGNIQGVITLTDILRAIVGDFADTMDDKSTTILKRQDGSWIVDGLVTIQELRERLELSKLRGEDSGNFHTTAGFILSELGRIPKPGDSFESEGVRYEVMDMDGNRVDKVLIEVLRQPHDAL